MALVNPSGPMKFWKDGLPAEGVVLDANPGGNCMYWFNGLPSEWVDPTAGGAPPAGPANLKTYNTNPKANIKSIDTNLIANVKTLNTNA